jgi:hypothetical protein
MEKQLSVENIEKLTVKFTILHAMKVQSGSRGTALLIL